MVLKDFLDVPIKLDARTTVSKAAFQLLENKRYEALVFQNKKLIGVLDAKELAKRNIPNPDKVKIKKYTRSVNSFPDNTPPRDFVTTMLINDFRAVPVTVRGRLYVLNKMGLLSMIKSSKRFDRIYVEDVMNFPYCVSQNDTISTAAGIIKQTGVSRLPVLNANSGLEGLVDVLDLLKAEKRMQRSKRGERVGYKIKLSDVPVSAIANKNVPVLNPKDSIRDVIRVMFEKKIPSVVIVDRGKVTGIVTPKNILKLLGEEKEGLYVSISGIQNEDNFIKEILDEEIRNEASKLNKIIPLVNLIIHIDKHHKGGRTKRVKYSIKAKLMTRRGTFFAKAFDWDITKAMREVLHRFERAMIRKKEKADTYGKAP